MIGKKSTNAINIISLTSMLGMMVGAFALILVLSVFNGFEGLVISLYNSFYSDIAITATSGKTFQADEKMIATLSNTKEIAAYSQCLEENAYFKYGEKDYVATLKGVDTNYAKVTGIADQIRIGSFSIFDTAYHYAVFGALIFQALNINVENGIFPVQITVPKNESGTVFIPEDAFNVAEAVPAGVFSIQQEIDEKYVFTDLAFAQTLIGAEGSISAIEIKLKNEADIAAVKEKLQKTFGNNFTIKTKYEQKQTLYRVMKMERWAVFAILSLIMGVIAFNIIGSLSMLVLEKKNDIRILKAMGADSSMIQKIFLAEGSLMALGGAVIGMLLATILCLLQMKFHFVKLSNGGGSFVIDYYPVALHATDYFATLLVVLVITLLASYFPAKKAGKSTN